MTIRPGAGATPVLITVPHAGRAEPPGMAALLRIPSDRLLPLEDRFVDLLAGDAERAGVSVIRADHPRAWIDLNRREDELDPAMVAGPWTDMPLAASAKMLGGLGLIPRRLAGVGDIWRAPLAPDDVRQRIADVHRPFHATVASALARIRQRHGFAVLIDLHSMPAPAPDIVLGDLFGRTAGAGLVERLMTSARAHGLSAARNRPYAGGHVIERHGNPASGIAAVQIEVSRHRYLQGDRSTPDPAGVARLSAVIADFAAIAGTANDHLLADAAE